MIKHLLPYLMVAIFLSLTVQVETVVAGTIEYDLSIEEKTVNFTGKSVEAMTINGSIPGPTIEFTEGDLAVIRVHNKMEVETSIHWHGILLPNREDGVPYLTTPPIKPGTTHRFSFPIIQSGTYWYHSHTGLQEQRGVYGSIVIHPQGESPIDREYVLVLSDWTDENPDEVLRTLKRGSEYYSLKKGSMQSVLGAIQAGAVKESLLRSFSRMPPMDISDVGYDLFLVNGKQESTLAADPGDTIRLRIINAAASTYFYLQFAGGPVKITAADGLNVKPVDLERILIGIAETYDVLITIPKHGGSHEFRATAQDGSGHGSVYLGAGEKTSAPDIPKPNIYLMHGEGHTGGHSAHSADSSHETPAPPSSHGMDQQKSSVNHGGHGTMKMHHDMAMPPSTHDAHQMHGAGKTADSHAPIIADERPLAPYDNLSAPEPTALAPGNPLQEITLTLTGDMERYVWSFDGKTLTEADMIRIRRGENVRITFVNETMMHHPLHLHGHFFRVVNRHGDYSPLKHTVDIAPMESRVIEFFADEEKDWFLHCHILYHMESGMARVVHYEDSPIDPDIADLRKQPNMLNTDHWYAWGEISLLTQMTEGLLTAANTRNTLGFGWEKGWDDEEHEINATWGWYFDRFFSVFGGACFEPEEVRGIAGVRYLLPFLIESEVRADTEGEARITLEKAIPLTSRLHLVGESQYDTLEKWEWSAALEYTVNRYVSVAARYHSEFDGGIGILIRF